MADNPAAWHPDPLGRYDSRWWDGQQWTDHVATDGEATVDPNGTEPSAVPQSSRSEDRVQRQVQDQVARSGGGSGRPDDARGNVDLLDADVLVVNQKAKLVELSNEYMVYDEHGTQVGAVRQVGQSTMRKAMRFLGGIDQYLTHTLEIADATGRTLLRLTRPAKVFKSTVVVADPAGREIGRIVQQNVFGKIRFDLEAGGTTVGSLRAENWRAWDFAILDADDVEVARIKKNFTGIARAVFTTADSYVLRVHRPLQDPLRSLVVAAALSVDLALKQDDD